jgi:hypothetical protein
LNGIRATGEGTVHDERRELMLQVLDLLVTAGECPRYAYVVPYDCGGCGLDDESDVALEVDTARTNTINASALTERLAAMCEPG